MRKYVITSSVYAGLGLLAGVFYREFTKMKGFSGVTALGRVHPHLLGLGMLVFLLVGLLAIKFSLEKYHCYRWFFGVYNAGLILTSIMFTIRGIYEVNGTEISKTLDTSISGMAGFGHILMAVGIVLLFVALFKATKGEKKAKEEAK